MGLYDRPYLRDEDEEEPYRYGSSFDIVRDLGASHWIILACVAVWVIGFFTDQIGVFGGRGILLGPGPYPQDQPAWRWLPDVLALKTDFYQTQPWSVWRLVSYAFVHTPMPMHLLFNCLGLWTFGRMVEERIGARGLVIFYFTAILVGGGVAVVYHILLGIYRGGEAHGLVFGASGGVTATAVLFAFLSPPEKKLLLFPFPIAIPAWGAAALFVGGGVIWSLFSGDVTATEVHLAGLAVGLAAGVTRDRWLRWIPMRWLPRTDELRVYEGEEDGLPEEEDDYGYAFTTQADEQQRSIESEADRLLDKVHREGTGSLTDDERRTLEDYSRKMREKRRR